MIGQRLEDHKKYIVGLVGAGTFFFGFFAGAIASLYLLSIHSALVEGLRTSLNFKSAIFGDGIILPVANMFAASFLINHKKRIFKRLVRNSFLIGLVITAYFHLNQAINGLVNWAMPTPWHWNILGLWHAIYMFSVCTFLSCFYLVTFRFIRATKKVSYEAYVVTISLVLFFILLHLDYVSLSIGSLILR